MPNWKKVIVSGSDASLNSVFANSVTASIFSGSFTGSLQGTSSWATNAISSSFPITVTGSTLRSVSPSGGVGGNTADSIFLGSSAGLNATNASDSNFLGNAAGQSATSANASNFFGRNAGFGATSAGFSNFFGNNAGASSTNASYSTLIGFQAGYRASGTSIGSNNIIIGTNITLPGATQNSINLGAIIFGTGSYSTTSGNPFSGSANGRVGINVVNPIYTLDVLGSGNYTNGLTVTGSFNVSGNQTITGSLSISGSSSTSSYLLDASGTSRLTTLHVQNLKNPAGGQIDLYVVGNPGDASYAKLSILAGGSPYSTVLRTSGDGGGSTTMLIDAPNPGGEIYIGTSGANRWTFSGNYNALGTGHILPAGDSLYNIGHITSKVANYYGVNSYLSNLLNVTGSVIISGSTIMTGSLNVTNGITGSLLGTAATASFVNTLNQSVIITGSLTVGTSSLGSNENTLILGPAPAGGNGEGGQLLLQAPNSGSYTSASMLDNWQNSTRLLRGSNASSDAVVTQWNMHTKQVSFPAYNSVSSFPGTAVANLAVDSGGNILTVSTSGGSVFPYTGVAAINGGLIVTGSITASSAIYAQANGAMYFRGGDDAELWDINVTNTLGVYGQQDQGVGSIKLGSGGGTISGRSGSIGIGTITPTSASLTVNGNVWATSFTGSLLGTAATASFVTIAQTASFVTTAQTASYVLQAVSASFATLAQTANTASFVVTAQTASFVSTASFASNANLLDGLDSTVFATTGSNTFVGNQTITGSVLLSGSADIELTVLGDQVNTGSLTIRSGNVTINTGSLVINSGSITVNTNGDSRVFASTFRPVGSFGQNLYIGHAGTTNTFTSGNDASFNTSVGVTALDSNTRGNLNTAVGWSAGSAITTGVQNTAVGALSLNNSLVNSNNTAIGYQTITNADGFQNTALGSNAGSNITGFITSSIYIGYNALGLNAGGLSGQTNNEIVIGADTTGLGSNTVVLGNSSITTTILRGKVGIGTTSPVNVLDVVGNVSASWYTGSLFGTASFAVSASWAPGGSGASFPYTGSAVITGSLVLTGSFDIGPAKFNATSSATTAGTTIVSTNATASYNSAFYNYYISSGSNARAGQIMSVWSGSTINYTEVTTTDIGNTNTASFAVTLATGNVRLSFTAPGVWTVKSIANLL
jgi:hypothetical protein